MTADPQTEIQNEINELIKQRNSIVDWMNTCQQDLVFDLDRQIKLRNEYDEITDQIAFLNLSLMSQREKELKLHEEYHNYMTA